MVEHALFVIAMPDISPTRVIVSIVARHTGLCNSGRHSIGQALAYRALSVCCV
jgi:hypothetical protein